MSFIENDCSFPSASVHRCVTVTVSGATSSQQNELGALIGSKHALLALIEAAFQVNCPHVDITTPSLSDTVLPSVTLLKLESEWRIDRNRFGSTSTYSSKNS